MTRLSKPLAFAVSFAHVVKRHGFDPAELACLIARSERAFHEGKRWCNEPGRESRYAKAKQSVCDQAAGMGLKTSWPGLYPAFTRDGETVFLPAL